MKSYASGIRICRNMEMCIVCNKQVNLYGIFIINKPTNLNWAGLVVPARARNNDIAEINDDRCLSLIVDDITVTVFLETSRAALVCSDKIHSHTTSVRSIIIVCLKQSNLQQNYR